MPRACVPTHFSDGETRTGTVTLMTQQEMYKRLYAARCGRKGSQMKPRKPLRKVSKRRQKDNAVYARKKKAFLDEHQWCAVCLRFVWDREVHHWAGRVSKLLLEERLWLAVCPHCHEWIHNNPSQARRRGFLAPKGCWNDYKRAMAARPEVMK